MKKLLPILLLVSFLLCGCTKAYTEPEQIIIISAIGIDKTENGILLTLETVDTSKPDGNWEYSPKTLETTEKNCQSAYYRLQQSLGNKLNNEHCVLVIVGKGLEKDTVLSSLEFLSKTENLSQNAKVIKSESANDLIKTKSFSGQAVGYDVVKILTLQSGKEISLKSNLYNVLKNRKNGDLQLPEIKIEDGKYFFIGE